jgi:hypothetical protein
MEAPINFNIEKISNAVKALVRSRAIKYGSIIAYEENGSIVKEDPRTGNKVIVQFPEKK